MSVYTGEDVVSAGMITALEQRISEYVAVDGRLAAAEGDRDAAIKSWMETADHADAVKLRRAIDEANKRLRALAEQNTKQETLSDADKEKLTKEREALRVKIRAGFDATRSMAKVLEKDVEGVEKALNELTDPTKSNRGRKPGSAGSDLPRVSVNVTLYSDQAPDQKVHCSTLSQAALKLNSEVRDLQLAFAEAAGVKHEDIKTVTKPVTFKFTPNGAKTAWTLETTPKERAKPGRKPAAQSASEQSETQAA